LSAWRSNFLISVALLATLSFLWHTAEDLQDCVGFFRLNLMQLSPRGHKVLGFLFGMLGIAWMVYFAWVVLIWIATDFSWGRMISAWYEQTLKGLAKGGIVGIPIAFILIAVTMGGWALLPLWIAVGIDRVQKRIARSSAASQGKNQ
jgi:hypothetical protein